VAHLNRPASDNSTGLPTVVRPWPKARKPVDALWTIRNGYALCRTDGLAAIGIYFKAGSAAESDALRALLKIGGYWTFRLLIVNCGALRFCSALPVVYTS
jgi:hypothetical protein